MILNTHFKVQMNRLRFSAAWQARYSHGRLVFLDDRQDQVDQVAQADLALQPSQRDLVGQQDLDDLLDQTLPWILLVQGLQAAQRVQASLVDLSHREIP